MNSSNICNQLNVKRNLIVAACELAITIVLFFPLFNYIIQLRSIKVSRCTKRHYKPLLINSIVGTKNRVPLFTFIVGSLVDSDDFSEMIQHLRTQIFL